MILTLESSKEYELLDSGEGEKLERFGDFILSRPDPQALWRKKLDQSEWKKASAVFTRDENKGDWNVKKDLPSKWEIELAGLKFFIKPTPFKHVGIFPEQAANWEWMTKLITKSELKVSPSNSFNSDLVEIEVLNLFAYTGGATLAAAKAGAKAVHVDGSKAAITWANENAELSGLKDKPIRWILEDARSFVKREIKRGRKYHGIVMDPPSFGHGPENELWKIEEDFLPLLEDCIKLLADKPLFFLINGYSAGYSAIAYNNSLQELKEKFGGSTEMGELTIKESRSDRLLPCGIFARWSQ
jgi:23S rRNA (cytosine1962-C5)-methyltransferase